MLAALATATAALQCGGALTFTDGSDPAESSDADGALGDDAFDGSVADVATDSDDNEGSDRFDSATVGRQRELVGRVELWSAESPPGTARWASGIGVQFGNAPERGSGGASTQIGPST